MVKNENIFQTFGPGWPFIFGALVLLVLLFFAVRMIQPGSEQAASPGLARGSTL